ncbi:hypothetical protein ACXR0O_17670 [Verrucomicrobiota bacterium sgz303538]
MKQSKLVGIALGCALLIGLVAFFVYGATAPSASDLKNLGDPIVIQLKAYRTQHGRFPSSLEEAGIQSPNTRYGHFYYTPVPPDDSFILSVGDYERDGIMVFRQSGADEWSVYE